MLTDTLPNPGRAVFGGDLDPDSVRFLRAQQQHERKLREKLERLENQELSEFEAMQMKLASSASKSPAVVVSDIAEPPASVASPSPTPLSTGLVGVVIRRRKPDKANAEKRDKKKKKKTKKKRKLPQGSDGTASSPTASLPSVSPKRLREKKCTDGGQKTDNKSHHVDNLSSESASNSTAENGSSAAVNFGFDDYGQSSSDES